MREAKALSPKRRKTGQYAPVAALGMCALFASSCATSMTPGQFMTEFPEATETKFYRRTDAAAAVASGECEVLVANRDYSAPIGLTVGQDLNNGAKGVDEWVRLDGGNAFGLNSFEWIDLGDKTQLIIYFNTMVCGQPKPQEVDV